MNIKDGIKTGIGFTIGMSLTCGALKFISEKLMKRMANDEEYMEQAKTNDPNWYEELKKYIKHD